MCGRLESLNQGSLSRFYGCADYDFDRFAAGSSFHAKVSRSIRPRKDGPFQVTSAKASKP